MAVTSALRYSSSTTSPFVSRWQRKTLAGARHYAKLGHHTRIGFRNKNRREAATNIRDFPDRVQLSVEFWGAKASDLSIVVENRILTIGRMPFGRTWKFRLDPTIRADEITATLNDGVLVVLAPKTLWSAASAHQVPVNTTTASLSATASFEEKDTS
jgi:HSP20 family molecular chaperone IbpA